MKSLPGPPTRAGIFENPGCNYYQLTREMGIVFVTTNKPIHCCNLVAKSSKSGNWQTDLVTDKIFLATENYPWQLDVRLDTAWVTLQYKQTWSASLLERPQFAPPGMLTFIFYHWNSSSPYRENCRMVPMESPQNDFSSQQSHFFLDFLHNKPAFHNCLMIATWCWPGVLVRTLWHHINLYNSLWAVIMLHLHH